MTWNDDMDAAPKGEPILVWSHGDPNPVVAELDGIHAYILDDDGYTVCDGWGDAICFIPTHWCRITPPGGDNA